jgi:hypothetical protein
MAALATANSAILATNSSGVPSITTASGNWNNTSRSCFLANLTSALTDAWGDGGVYTVIPATSIFDQGSNYSTSTGAFTAPVTGKYFFTYSVSLSNTGGTTAASATSFLVATSRTLVGGADPFITGDPSNIITLLGSFIIDMSSGDTAKIQIEGTTTAGTKTGTFYGASGNAYTWFSGYLIC